MNTHKQALKLKDEIEECFLRNLAIFMEHLPELDDREVILMDGFKEIISASAANLAQGLADRIKDPD